MLMANPDHLTQLAGGSAAWNEWRGLNPAVRPDLSGADLSMATARAAAAGRALLCGGLGGGVRDLSDMDLSGADLTGASLVGQVLTGANLRRADLSGADLGHVHLVEVDLRDAKINGCRVYGISTWNVDLRGAEQENLFINSDREPTITVDYLEVAQFIYLLLNNAKIRSVIDTITSKAVLILGRFTPERKAVLDALREALRVRGYLPVLFDFGKPANRDITETVSTLAHLARFVVADITDAKSIPQELERVVPGLPSVPVQPLLRSTTDEYGMFEHYKRYPWVLEPFLYADVADMIASIEDKIIGPCERRLA
jgi:hypothetical protein